MFYATQFIEKWYYTWTSTTFFAPCYQRVNTVNERVREQLCLYIESLEIYDKFLFDNGQPDDNLRCNITGLDGNDTTASAHRLVCLSNVIILGYVFPGKCINFDTLAKCYLAHFHQCRNQPTHTVCCCCYANRIKRFRNSFWRDLGNIILASGIWRVINSLQRFTTHPLISLDAVQVRLPCLRFS